MMSSVPVEDLWKMTKGQSKSKWQENHKQTVKEYM
jgi:hypothetical protein